MAPAASPEPALASKMPPIIVNKDQPVESTKEITYARYKMDAMPPVPLNGISSTLKKIITEVRSKTWSICCAEADCGNLVSMVDLGLRFLVGLGTPCNKAQATVYLTRATQAPTTSRQDNNVKATAHSLLLESLGVLPHASLECPSFEVLRLAEFHASQSMHLRHGKPLSANVLTFCSTFNRIRNEPGIFGGHEDLWEAVRSRNEDIRKADEKLKEKRQARPSRYRCATVGCGILAEKGTALRQCGGQCDPGHKPVYCSRECQIKDRPIHREFCKSGAGGPLTEGLLYKDGDEEEHIEIVAAQQFPGPNVTLPIRSSNGKLYLLRGKREVLQSVTLTTLTKLEELPGYNSGVIAVV